MSYYSGACAFFTWLTPGELQGLPRHYSSRSATPKRAHERLHAHGWSHPSRIRMLGCMHALLLAGVNTQLINVHGGTAPQWAEVKGQPTTAKQVCLSVRHGELRKVVKWLRKGGAVDALCTVPTVEGGQTAAFGLLHAAATNGQLEMVRVLLKRGASVDLPSSLNTTALMSAAYRGHLSTSCSSSCSTRPTPTCSPTTATPL